MFFPERIRRIGANDRVLEVGPGSCPHPRSDVLLEKKFSDPSEAEAQRGYGPPLQTDKEIVYHDESTFPFRDGEFDYVICSHVLEHVPEPEHFVAEILRVGRAGYIEFPTLYYDYIYDFPEHVNALFHRDGVVYWMPKSDTGIEKFRPISSLFYESLKQGYTAMIDDLAPYFFQGFEWRGNFGLQRARSLSELTYRANELQIPQKRNPRRPALVRLTGRLVRFLGRRSGPGRQR